ncbi:hypothetical protein PIB30_046375 [Stylosanthes scabra]|uniref:Uncharacterized protein n=1 Tax=Stylosanthes scabra TaxID=79078 RepID=A0ABU6QGQ5_9FABA|nr:hypothetical protein [Stylosanthes scabra]
MGILTHVGVHSDEKDMLMWAHSPFIKSFLQVFYEKQGANGQNEYVQLYNIIKEEPSPSKSGVANVSPLTVADAQPAPGDAAFTALAVVLAGLLYHLLISHATATPSRPRSSSLRRCLLHLPPPQATPPPPPFLAGSDTVHPQPPPPLLRSRSFRFFIVVISNI